MKFEHVALLRGKKNTLWILIFQLFLKLVYFQSNDDIEGTFEKLINLLLLWLCFFQSCIIKELFKWKPKYVM